MSKIEVFENRAFRDRLADKVEVLNGVKVVPILPDNIHTTVKLIARYYQVSTVTIQYVIARHRDELELSGMKCLDSKELKEYKDRWNLVELKKLVSCLLIMPLETVLRIGMLLVDKSDIAKRVKDALLVAKRTPAAKASDSWTKQLVEAANHLADQARWIMSQQTVIDDLRNKVSRIENLFETNGQILRARANELVRQLATRLGIEKHKAYNLAYKKLGEKLGINLFERASENDLTKIEYLQKHRLLPEFIEVLEKF